MRTFGYQTTNIKLITESIIMKKTAVFLIACFILSITVSAQRPKDKIIINKRPTNSTSTQTNQNQFPKTNNQSKSTNQQQQQNRAKHDYSKKRDHIELRYTVQKTGQNSKHTHYRIIGNIYSDNLTEALFNHNKRIVLFQIDNWDSGFFGDNIESIDGYATNQQLNQQSGGGPLYQFGNSPEREFSFDFKVKNGRQPAVKVEIYPDWKVYKEYEPYLVLDYATLNGNWIQENNPEVKFNMQFSAQGDQIVMKDLLGQTLTWSLAKENSYVRQIGTAPQQTQNNNPNSSTTGAPPGGYLGGNKNSGNTSNNNNNNGNAQPSNYPSGGYLGGNKNSNNSGNYNSNSNNNSVNNGTVEPESAYSSVWQVVDRTTLKYYNSEGIVVNFKKGE